MDEEIFEKHIDYLVSCIEQLRKELFLDATVRQNLIAAMEAEIQRLKGGKPRHIVGEMHLGQ